jgi:hypothetical protein
MTYDRNAHPQYSRVRAEVELCPHTYALLPSFDREVCVSETVRRQIARPFGRSALREEAVIRARFEVYRAMPVRKIKTRRPVSAVVDELVVALTSEHHVISTPERRQTILKRSLTHDHGVGFTGRCSGRTVADLDRATAGISGVIGTNEMEVRRGRTGSAAPSGQPTGTASCVIPGRKRGGSAVFDITGGSAAISSAPQ